MRERDYVNYSSSVYLHPCDYTPLNSYLQPFIEAYSSQASTTAIGGTSPGLLLIVCTAYHVCSCLSNFSLVILMFSFVALYSLTSKISWLRGVKKTRRKETKVERNC